VAKEIGLKVLKEAVKITATNLKVELQKKHEIRRDTGFDIEKNVVMR
jgi:hypothetical protein